MYILESNLMRVGKYIFKVQNSCSLDKYVFIDFAIPLMIINLYNRNLKCQHLKQGFRFEITV